MINREKDKLVAEAMGLCVASEISVDGPVHYITENIPSDNYYCCPALPRYTESLDACAEILEFIRRERKAPEFICEVMEMGVENGRVDQGVSAYCMLGIMQTEPSQIVDVFLKVMGVTNAKR